MAQEPVIQIWPGSSSFSVGDTSYGLYDTDTSFILEADKFASWCAKRLGHPITSVELTAGHFYDALETAITDYSTYVNTYAARDNMLSLTGQPTASLELEEQYIEPNLQGVFELAEAYGQYVGYGGTLKHYTGSVNLIEDQQIYDLDSPGVVNLEKGDFTSDRFEIRRIYYDNQSPLSKYIDPIGFSGIANQDFLNQFGWGNMGVVYTLMPLHYDLLRMQGIEMHQQIRKAAHSFHLAGNRLMIFPIPQESAKLYFKYTLDDDSLDAVRSGSNKGRITDISNIPYHNKTYTYINDIGKQWIRRYALAIAKEMLGINRAKYQSLPMTLNNDITLNGPELISDAKEEQTNLIEELKLTLDDMSRQSQLERKIAEGEALSSMMNRAPLKIYVK